MDISQVIADLQKVRWKRGPYVWEPFMRKYNCDIVCEVGVQKGVNFAEMIRHNPSIAVAVDSWIDDGVIGRNEGRSSQTILDAVYEGFKKSVADKPFVSIYREYSFEAVKRFADDYFDLVYIDADHTYEGCFRDINDWYSKVKTGRFLLGDDYRESNYRVKFGVIEAVNEFAKTNNLDFFVLRHYGWGIIKR